MSAERDFAAEERQRWGGPSPFAGRGERQLTSAERIEARHLLQELTENARTARNALDPVSGMLAVRVSQWRAQYEALTAALREFTEKVS